MDNNFHSHGISDLFTNLKTSNKGLKPIEVKKRKEKFGLNSLPKQKKLSALKLFLGQFKNPLIYILIFAFVISFATNHQTDAWLIFFVTMLSVVVGFVQEFKANSALEHLKDLVRYKARVIRDGEEHIIEQTDLVPGDIIVLNAGDKVPADARLFEINNLEVVESALTGESMPILKNTSVLDEDKSVADRKNMVHMGTVISRGSGKAIVTQTGKNTEIGHIAFMIHQTEEGITPLQRQIINFGKSIGVILIVVNIFIFLVGILSGKPIFEMFMTSVAMIVAGVPEGLLPAMTVILSIGMQRLSKHNALVKKLLATETLGSVSIICSDKTGTLTTGTMTVDKILTEKSDIDHDGVNFSEIIEPDGDASHITALKIGMLCNDAVIENSDDELHELEVIGDPTEKALLLASRSAGLNNIKVQKALPRVTEIPFESENKFMVTAHKVDGEGYILYMKGAPEKVLSLSEFIDIEGEIKTLSPQKIEGITAQYEKLTNSGLRVLAVAYKIRKNGDDSIVLDKNNQNNYVFVGLIGLKDPLRNEAKETIELCKKAGIKPIIITGDHKLTAMAIVNDLGLDVTEDEVMEGTELETIKDEHLINRIEKIHVFARVAPKHKIRIVDALQKEHNIVAMTGDGINDAPALKKADIGIALGSGTDVAKETSDMVLMDDNFKTIIEAIEQGRGTFDNIRKVVLYLLANSFTEVILIGASIAFGMPLPLLPVQILWVKMIEDSLPSMALAFDPIEKNVLFRKPRDPKESILNKKLKTLLFLFIAIADSLLFIIFIFTNKFYSNPSYMQTSIFAAHSITSLFYIFSIRGLSRSILHYNPFKNRLVNISALFGFAMILVAIYLPFLNNVLGTKPLEPIGWIIPIAYGLLTIFIYELAKKIVFKKV